MSTTEASSTTHSTRSPREMAATDVLQQRSNSFVFQPKQRKTSSSSYSFLESATAPFSSSPKQHQPPSFIESGEHNERITSSPSTSSFDSYSQASMTDYSYDTSLSSTPSSSRLSFDDSFKAANDEIDFPNYDSLHYPSQSQRTDDRSTDEDTEVPEISTTTDTTASDSPLPTPSVADDSAIKQQPSQHVDYLSHDWREEDIWSSWRHIVSQRRVYGQRSRLENASWRTWAKSKYKLPTISPEALNWLKESDVTWLYGPLKLAQSHPITSDTATPNSQISKSPSFIKKPILKKRSVSEVMLQKSLSTSSLVKQAAAAVQAQGRSPRRSLGRVSSDLPFRSTLRGPIEPPSREEFDYFSSRESSAVGETPSDSKEKHIRFDEVVEQCVAVECKDPLFEDGSDDEAEEDPPNSALSESSSDEGLLMMGKRTKAGPSKDSSQRGRMSRTNSSGGKMIETIEATTLKNRTDSPDITEQQPQHHTFGKDWGSAVLSPSPSQETLRPSRPSRNFLLAEEDDEDDPDTSASWSFGANNPQSSLGASANAWPSNPYEFKLSDGYEEMAGMRRTPSGMFMPIDEDEDDRMAEGLFGKVSETIGTVKDIGWVLWNSFSQNRDT